MRTAKLITKTDEPLHIAEGLYLTKAQVARRYGVIHQTVQQWIDKGWLSSIKIPGLGHVIDAQALVRFAPPRSGRHVPGSSEDNRRTRPPADRARRPRKPRQIARVVRKGKMGEWSKGDLAYWRTRPAAERVLALEAIKQEFYGRAYTSQSRLAQVLAIVKREGR